jgi:hypothetical protein
MRSLLGRLGARGGAAIGLVLLVLAVVGIAQLIGGGSRPPVLAPEGQPPMTVDPTEGDDAEVAPTPTAYPDDAEVRDATLAFATAWIRRDLTPQAWHAGLAAHATDQLAESLAGVDPSGVPATRLTGTPTITLRTDLFAQVGVPADSGRLVLTLLKQGEEWLVDGVDWERL